MELHKHFMSIAAKEFSVLEIMGPAFDLKKSLGTIVTQFVADCLEDLKTENGTDRKKLELLRSFLCQQYKLEYENSEDNITRLHSNSSHEFMKLVASGNKLVIQSECFPILYNIMVLLLVLFEDQKNILCMLEELRLSNVTETVDKLSMASYLKVLKCFLSAWEIHYFISSNKVSKFMNLKYLESCKTALITLVMYDLQCCIKCTENEVWFALHSIASKIVSIARDAKIFSPYVHGILAEETALKTLCILCDFIFPLNTSNINADYNLLKSEKLWFIIKENLISRNPQYRKEALYLLKKLFIFIETNEAKIEEQINLDSGSNKLNSFISSESVPVECSIKEIRTNFVLIMEALEEKQKHLVLPSLSFTDNLIKSWAGHELSISGYDFSWTPCIFERLLEHDNNAIVKWGLLKLLSLKEGAYQDPKIISLILKYLNNTFLFEKNSICQSQPEIVTALINWFNNFEKHYTSVMQNFILCINNVSWGPVPIFYVLQSMLSTSNELNKRLTLDKSQISSLKSVIKANAKLHLPMLRSASQVTLIKILPQFFEVEDLFVVSDILSTFSQEDLKKSYYWTALTFLLAKIKNNNAVKFISYICDTLMVTDKHVKIPMPTFSIIIQLLYERKVICQDEPCIAKENLKNLLLCLDKVDIRPYVKVSLVFKIIDLIYSLYDLNRQPPQFFGQIFLSYKETIFKFILKMFHNPELDYEHVKICTRALQGSNNCIDKTSIVTKYNSIDLESRCLQVLSNDKQHNEIQLLFAIEVWSNIISNSYKYEDKYFIEKIIALLKMCKSREHETDFKGKVGLDFYIALSKVIVNNILAKNIANLKSINEWLPIMSSIFDAAGIEVLIYFGDIMKLYTNFVSDDPKKLEDFTSLINSFWNSIFSSKRDKIFWMAAQKLTTCINNSNFLDCNFFYEIFVHFNQKMLNEGESLPGLKYILLTCSEISSHLNYFAENILNGLLHGQVMRRDQRITMQALMKGKEIIDTYKLKDGNIENFEVYEFINRTSNMDATIRAAAVVQLCKVLYTAFTPNDSSYSEVASSIILNGMLEKLSAVRGKRYYADSQLHRLKHRLMQGLLIIQPYLNQTLIKQLYEVLCDSVIEESDQHSVRLLKEWLLIRIFLKCEYIFSFFWSFFEMVYGKRPNSISSVIGITWHIAQQLSGEKLENFVKAALPKLAICCMGQQFSMRLFGQVFFVKLYELLDEICDIRLAHTNFYNVTLQSLSLENVRISRLLLDEDFFYSSFNPIDHYSLETIYDHLPRLTNVSPEEWITKDCFEEQIALSNATVEIKLTNYDDVLEKAEVPYSILKSSEKPKSEEMECSEVTTDIQKKITPWKTILPNEEDLDEVLNSSDLRNENNAQNIIVVASFIEKAQNLGGIARTCEIFGVKELLISNLKQIEDKEFKALSVSADKWLKIIEVKPISLTAYLEKVKSSGWTLIGAEQTANSTSLLDFKFPKKTVLVLGNEKNGIPANIIPLLDTCVEIPQFGVTRSLNVHVTSAICLWEYVQQHRAS